LSDGPARQLPYTVCHEGLRLAVRLDPRSSANRILGPADDAAGRTRLKVAVTAVPESGKANDALVGLLAKALKRPKSTLSILSGATDRNKVVLIAGDAAELETSVKGALERL